MSITSDNFRVTSSDPVGATVATDFVGDAHYQHVKLNTGGEGVDALLGDANPVPVYSGKEYVKVAGTTDGSLPVEVKITGGASFDVSNVTIQAGNITNITAGVSCDIRTMGAGVTFPVKPVAGVTFAVTGDVKLMASTNNIGDVDVLTVAIPIGFTSAGFTIDEDSSLAKRTCPAGTFTTGFRITNMGPDTIYIGPTGGSAGGDDGGGLTGEAGESGEGQGYPLLKYGSMFIEASNSNGVQCVIDGTGTADIRICGT